ncbi:MAG: type II toxin-antitoxin system HicA family toxin [Patescibacteria group bacterium]|nr:type II toxin-antitoxin system HicA family toxin [Patescibacteria group bacterium]
MPKLPSIKPRTLIRIAKKEGFTQQTIHGSHVILRRPSDGKHICIPVHAGRDIQKGTFHGIVKDMGLTIEEFQKKL